MWGSTILRHFSRKSSVATDRKCRLLRRAVFALGLGAALSGPASAGPTGEPDPELRKALRVAIAESSSFRDRFDAQVWLMDMSGRLKSTVPDAEKRLRLLRLVHQEARRVDLPPELVLAVIDVESNFDRFAISRVGARGLMQIMPFWLDEIGRPEDNLFDIRTNLRMGCTILRHYLDREDGHLGRALARYNGSLGQHWYSERVLSRLSKIWYRN